MSFRMTTSTGKWQSNTQVLSIANSTSVGYTVTQRQSPFPSFHSLNPAHSRDVTLLLSWPVAVSQRFARENNRGSLGDGMESSLSNVPRSRPLLLRNSPAPNTVTINPIASDL